MGRGTLSRVVAVFGGLALAFALLSIVDILVAAPLRRRRPGGRPVGDALRARGRPRLGRRPGGHPAGDRIVGIDRTVLSSSAQAGRLLARHQIGDDVPYLVRARRRPRGRARGPARPALHRQRALLLRLPARLRLLRGRPSSSCAASRSSGRRRSSTSSARSSCSSWSAACGRPPTAGSTGWCSRPGP